MFSLVGTFFYFQISFKLIFPYKARTAVILKEFSLSHSNYSLQPSFSDKFNMCIIQPLPSVLVDFKVSLFHCGVSPLLPFPGRTPRNNLYDYKQYRLILRFCWASVFLSFPCCLYFPHRFPIAWNSILLSKWNVNGSNA